MAHPESFNDFGGRLLHTSFQAGVGVGWPWMSAFAWSDCQFLQKIKEEEKKEKRNRVTGYGKWQLKSNSYGTCPYQ